MFEIRHKVCVTWIARQFLDNARRKGVDDDDLFAGEVDAVERVLGVGDVLFNHDGRICPETFFNHSAFEGLVALFRDEYFLVGPRGLTVNVDYTAWGWAHLIGGIIVLAAGFGVASGQVWARTVGVIVAMLSIIANVGFMAAYPFWSLTMIALAVVIIMALTVHGSDVRAD